MVVYPGGKKHMVTSTPDALTARFRSYQVDDFFDDPQDIISRKEAEVGTAAAPFKFALLVPALLFVFVAVIARVVQRRV